MKRVLTAVVLLPIFILCVLAPNPVYFYGLVALAAVLCASEYSGIAKASGAVPFNVLLYPFTLAFLATLVWPSIFTLQRVLAALFFCLLAAGLIRRASVKKALASVAGTLFGVLYVGFLLSFMIALRQTDDALGARLIFLMCLGVWAGDSAAYYVGKSLGRHKLNTRLSPKKTWEGAAANVLGSILGVAAARWTFLPSLSVGDVVALGVLLAVVGIMGDLFESMLKRGAGVKDSSSLLPGHGGLLDRLDSVLFNGPLLFYYHQVFMK